VHNLLRGARRDEHRQAYQGHSGHTESSNGKRTFLFVTVWMEISKKRFAPHVNETFGTFSASNT